MEELILKLSMHCPYLEELGNYFPTSSFPITFFLAAKQKMQFRKFGNFSVYA